MIGEKFIDIDWRDFVRGMTTANNTLDGGFSIGAGGIDDLTFSICNLSAKPGYLSFPVAPTDKSTNLTGQIIGSTNDATTANDYSRIIVSANASQHGYFYTMDTSGNLTQRGSADTTNNYIEGRTDIIVYKSEVYVTNNNTIVRWQLPATFNDGATFPFSFTNTTAAPHPAIVYENNAYFGDGNKLLRMTSAGGTPSAILELPSNQVIIALGIDPASGRMVISITDQADPSGMYNVNPRVGYYNGYSNKLDKIVPVDEMITCFYPHEGTLYVGFGTNLGYWSGTGIQLVKKLLFGRVNTQLLYKHRITNVGPILYIVEKSRILAYGEVLPGYGKVWWYTFVNIPSATLTAITSIFHMGSGLIGYSFATSKFSTWNSLGVGGTADIYWTTRKYNFPKLVTFTNAVIQYADNLSTGTTIGIVNVRNENNVGTDILTVNTATAVKTIECPFPTMQARSLQLRYAAVQNAPIERITLFYNDKR